jgi:HD-GYP domain-containing protein (c-di-GMP phosphodiesterase class II)
MATNGLRSQDLVLSGGFGTSTNSARSGFLPVCLARLPLQAIEGIDIYLRNTRGAEGKESFTLFCAQTISFNEEHRKRLSDAGVKFIYIAMAQQAKFREQTEARLLEVVDDPSTAVSIKSEIMYETSVELVNELLSEPDLAAKSPRLEKISRAVTTLVLNDPTAFSHLFAASHHDFYTATHMVNVATWMVPLAYAMGHHDPEELGQICQAGMLHDIGKMYIPAEILNKKEKLTDAEWKQIQTHPQLGCDHLAKYDHIRPLVHTITLEHHERMDGSGYPRGIKGSEMHPISRLCAVVDSFDAMTAFRPFKHRTMSVAEAMKNIMDETPRKYDPAVVEAWVGLVKAAETLVAGDSDGASCDVRGRREFERFRINCPARLHVMEQTGEEWKERPGLQMVAHNISRSGLGLMSQAPVKPGEHNRIYLLGAGSQNRTREGIAVRCREYRDGWFEIGIKCAPLISEAHAQDIASLMSAA